MSRLAGITAVIALALAAPPAIAQAADPAKKIDALFAKATADTPGCAIGIAQNGKTVLERAYGAADLEHGVMNTPQTIFESGSVAKQFTASAILLLEKDGKLKLSDDIRKYLPEMPDYGTPITVEMLLNHTSGLRDWGNVSAASGRPRGTHSFTNKDVLDILSRQKALNYKPGAEYSYTNSGYNLAAIIVERVSGKSFPDFTRDRIFTPLGMTHTSWRDDFNRIIKGRAMAYSPAGPSGPYKQSMPFMNVVGNGGMLTTVGDFLIWNEALTQDRLGLTKALEKKGVLNDGREIAYARGLQVQDYRGITEVSHSGSTGGYTTWLARYPQHKLSVSMLCNGQPPGMSFTTVRDLADAFLPPATAAAQPSAAAPADAAGLTGFFVNTATGFPARLEMSGDKLQIASFAAPTLPLNRTTEGRWTFGGGALPIGGTLTFAGADKFLLATSDGNSYDYVRTPRVTPSSEQLAEYAATFYSDETGATYRTDVENGQLALKIDRAPEATLKVTPSYKDAFLGGQTLIRFQRNSAGRIIELSIGDGRMRDLRAKRVN